MRSLGRGARFARRSAFRFVLLAALVAGGCGDDHLSRVYGTLEVTQHVDFGAVSLGRASEHVVEIKNAGRTPVTLLDCALELPAGEDWVVPTQSGRTLRAGESIRFPLSFVPTTLGLRAARINLASDAERTPQLSIELRGKGVLGDAELDTNVLDFGKVAVRATSTLSFHLVNGGENAAEVNVSVPTGLDAPDFRSSTSGEASIPKSATLGVDVTFAPQRLGVHEATIDVRACPSCALQTVRLRGEGIASTLDATPREIDFGFVESGQVATRTVEITNRGTKDAVIRRVGLSDTTPSDFTTPGLQGEVTLREGESTTVEVSFSSPLFAAREGTLRIEATANGNEVLLVPLRGDGGGPDIKVRPEALGFPRTGVGLKVEKKVTILNAGHDPTGQHPLRITDIRIDPASSPNGADFSLAFRHGRPIGPLELQAGEAETVFVTLDASRAGSFKAFLHIESNDADEPLVVVPLTGSASELGPCSYEVIPDRLDFGAVATDTSVRLAFGVRNTGANACAIANLRLASTSSRAFTLDERSTVIIDPGDTFVVPVSFRAQSPSSHTGHVLFDSTSTDRPQAEVELVARGVDSCVEVEPGLVDYGLVGLECLPPVRRVVVRNACAVAVEMYGAEIGGAPNAEFLLQSGATARTLQPGDETLFEIAYAPVDEGTDEAGLFIDTSAEDEPLLAGLIGEGALRPTAVDTFVQPALIEVDVLFVVDNSGSMMEEQDALSENFDRFIRSANARGVDYHLAVTTTGLYPYRGGMSDCPGGVQGGEAGRFFPVDNSRPRILTPQTPNVRDVFHDNVRVGICHWFEEGLEAARLALSPPLINSADAPNHPEPNDGNAGFLRDEARLYIIWISDEEDSGHVPTDEYVTFFRNLKPGRPDLISGSAIVGMPSCRTAPTVGTRYMAVVDALGGSSADICESDWGGLLERIGEEAFTRRLVFPLSEAPDGRDFTVSIDGDEVPARGANGKRNWRFDPTLGAHGAIVFEPHAAPGPNTTLDIRYPIPCPAPRGR